MVLGPGDRHEHRQVNRADSRLADNNALAPRIHRGVDRLHHLSLYGQALGSAFPAMPRSEPGMQTRDQR